MGRRKEKVIAPCPRCGKGMNISYGEGMLILICTNCNFQTEMLLG